MRLILNAVFCVFSLFIFIQGNCYSCDNIPPVADLRAVPECVTLGKSVILDGNTSFDPDGCIYFYGFNVTSVMENYDYMGTPPPIVAEHTYKKPGVYTARLTIKDNDGGGDADTCTITVTKVHNLTQNKPYSSIQNAINDANDFDVIEVSKA